MSVPGVDHTHARAQLSAYLDGELARAERERLDAHLAGCSSCAAELRQMESLDADLRGWQPADGEFVADRVALASFRLRLREHPAPLPPFYRAGQPTGRGLAFARILLPSVSLAVVLFIALVLSGGAPATREQRPEWSTFAGRLEGPGAPRFRIEYPTGWSLSQVALQRPLLATVRFSTYKPALGFGNETPTPKDAEVWVAFGQGSLKKGWPAEEVADLRDRGYTTRSLDLAGYDALRLTDSAPHFGTYDAVYLPVGDDFTLRLHLSAATSGYVQVFERMLTSLELGGPPATPTAIVD